MYTPDGSETLYITELLIGNMDSQIRFLFLNLDGTRPVYRDRKIILFFDVRNAEKALRYSDCGAGILTCIPKEIENKVDFALALGDLTAITYGTESVIGNAGNFLDCLQLLMDIYFDTIHASSIIQPLDTPTPKKLKVSVSPEEISNRFYRILFCAANFFMFNVDMQQFVHETGYAAEDVLSAFKYALGDLMTDAFFLCD